MPETIDLSSFYLDIMKNKLYTDHPDSRERRSAQTVMHIMADGLCKILSPLLPFTMDEVWENFRNNNAPESIHLTLWPELKMQSDTSRIEEKYVLLLELRGKVLARLEEARKQKMIGSALQAKVQLQIADKTLYQLLNEIPLKELRELFIVSGLEISQAAKENAETLITITPAEGSKCVRCWQYKTDIGQDSEHPEICLECLDVIHKLKK